MKPLILVVLLSAAALAQDFSRYFEDKTMRLDYYRTADSAASVYSFDGLLEEPYWGGPQKNLIDTFNYGFNKFEVYDAASNTLLYSRGYSTLAHEWQSTLEAKSVKRTFEESVIFPYPKNKVRIDLFERGKRNEWKKVFSYNADPADYFIKRERVMPFNSFEVHNSGAPAEKVDIVIIPEGYTAAEMDQFKKDCEKFTGYLFNSSPFKENKNKFNVWGIEAPSVNSGTDVPPKNVWKNTLVNTSFYTFDSDRYLMTSDYKTVRNAAANAPYDQIYILVNTDTYGGGSIYNYYSAAVNKNMYEEYVFVHEFGHGFASLADEYYTSDVAYNDFYPLDIEPSDPNITTLVNFESKWKDLVDPGTPIPTPASAEYEDTVGAFEGGGYVAKGVYRPMQDCTMKSAVVDKFCPVCSRAIEKMINFLTDK